MSKEATVQKVILRINAGVADLRFNRPDKLNAIDDQMISEILAAAEQISSDQTVRAVVLSGVGRGFCSGLDTALLSNMANRAQEKKQNGARSDSRITNRSQYVAWLWSELPVPVIASLHGVVFGGGLQIALGADIRIVSPKAALCP